MAESILNSTKKLLGIDESYKAYDTDIVIYINSALSNLTEVGVGPIQGFAIQDEQATWDQFLTEELDPLRYEKVKTYVYLFVKLIFDPPPTAFAVSAMERQIAEHIWRISVVREGLDNAVPLHP